METYHYETTLTRKGILTLTGLPFRVGERIEVIVHSHSKKHEQDERYPLRGQPIEYIDPFEPVSWDTWEVLQGGGLETGDWRLETGDWRLRVPSGQGDW